MCCSKLPGAKSLRWPLARMEPSTRRAWATRAIIRCPRCRCKGSAASPLPWCNPDRCSRHVSTSAPEGTEIYALADGQAPRKLWSGKDEIVYSLAMRSDGLLALTGNRGRLFRIADDGAYADMGHLEAQQGMSLAVVPSAGASAPSAALVIGTANTGKLYRFGAAASTHEYASDVLDAGALARFGRVEVQPGSTGYELWTRSGNVEQPVRGWSDWQPIERRCRRFAHRPLPAVESGAAYRRNRRQRGRKLSARKLRPRGRRSGGGSRARLNAQSLAGNQPTTINIAFPSAAQSATFDPGSAAALTAMKDRTAITARWAAHDDDGDDLTFALYLRGDGETAWRMLKDDITDKAYSFDAALIPDGGYQLKVVASDAPSHTPGDALTGSKASDRFEADTTPPVLNLLKAVAEESACAHAPCPMPVHVTFDAEDAASPIAHASIRWTRDRGNTSSQSAASPTRGASTTISICPRWRSVPRAPSICSPSGPTIGTIM